MRKKFFWATFLLITFVLWTISLRFLDVQAIGPNGSTVGFSTLNQSVHAFTGVNMWLYTVTDWLSLIPVAIGLGFALLGLSQWIRRKHLTDVDANILILGVFYILLFVVYLFFENAIINYRPVLISGFLEASYPSSTTMLVLCVMSTAAIQFQTRIKNKVLSRFVCSAITVFSVFMVTARLISGVHWFTDIVGGGLLSFALILLYQSACCFFQRNRTS